MTQLFIAGAWRDGVSVRANINPSDTSDIVGHYAQADRNLAEEAIAAARAAFPAWSRSTPQVRADALDRIGSEILARKDELGALLSREEGKTLPEGIGEAARAGQIFKFFAGEALRCGGERLPSVRPGLDVEITREALGVVGIITPWNFPIAIPAWKIAPALAHGNCVVFKPADLVPGSAWALAEIISRAGLPVGVFNLVTGPGSQVGQALLDSPDVDGITFTGSTVTGRRVMEATSRRFARMQLEMGGKNPLVVLDDADLAQAVFCAIQGGYDSTGQRCTASSRFIVEKGIYPAFVKAVSEGLAALKVDDALKPGTDIGPVVDGSQLAQDLDYIGIGRAEGARLVFGGERLSREKTGHYLSPAFFVDTDPAMRIAREEIFGPVACAIPADNYEHALALANDTEYGLSAGICTSSLKHASHFKRNVEAGMVMVNVPTAGVDYHVPFGGRKASSFGPREQGRYAEDFFTIVKTAYTGA
ncbi:aldehyde dehydrogenase family protein [Azoarcus sp. KH32C]|uniref:aldehyde dehydrogenase family protein n=1 Tax=Azoarcus sp. KH32C TaxID=748247 RepID=UPI0002385D0F|nr:aldehyde dehydrogenase family protein [Azoarcus sp. KH32C]BAL27514.1 NAD-dependent aldehyde dehydrogenase [Azoarcus sp. KH32C]